MPGSARPPSSWPAPIGSGGQRSVWVRCNNRRASVCASCSDLYARDTWQLVHAGLHGGHHRMPSSVAEHPQVFVTLTAPGFGPVHVTGNDKNGPHGRRCHDRGHGGYHRCRHGKPLWCSTIHGDDDARVGQPLCDDCYDYTGHVLFTWHAPELWRRFTIALRRLLDSHLRAIGEVAGSVGINYVKVTEMQRRAIPHFHAVIRMDGPPAPGDLSRPPVSSITATDLAMLVQRAARAVTLTVTDPDSDGDGSRDTFRHSNRHPATAPDQRHRARHAAPFLGPVGGGLLGQVRDEIGGRIRCRHPTHVPVSRD